MPEGRRKRSLLLAPDDQLNLSRLSGAGSLRQELEAVMRAMSSETKPFEYREAIMERNVVGKRSASMRLWTWKRLRVRYLLDPAVPEFVAFRTSMSSTTDPKEMGLLELLLMARTDRLFREVLEAHVSPFLKRPGTAVSETDIAATVDTIARQTKKGWSRSAVAGITSHILSSAKDYGVLDKRRTTVAIRPGPTVALFAMRLARLEGLSDRRSLEARWFRLLSLGLDEVVGLMHRAARQGLLQFRYQADLAEVELPELVQAS